MFEKIKLSVLAVGLVLSSAPISAQTVELVTGVGFGNTQPEAMQNAIRAWVIEGQRLYQTADFNTALRTEISCNESASAGASSGITTQGVRIEGDVSGAWSCSLSGLPLSALGG